MSGAGLHPRSLTAFSEELAELHKEAGLKDLAKKVPAVAKKLPEQGRKAVTRAGVVAAGLASKYPGLYRELHDPMNYASIPTTLTRIFGS
jgi:hypothetical protein